MNLRISVYCVSMFMCLFLYVCVFKSECLCLCLCVCVCVYSCVCIVYLCVCLHMCFYFLIGHGSCICVSVLYKPQIIFLLQNIDKLAWSLNVNNLLKSITNRKILKVRTTSLPRMIAYICQLIYDTLNVFKWVEISTFSKLHQINIVSIFLQEWENIVSSYNWEKSRISISKMFEIEKNLTHYWPDHKKD